MAGFGHRGPGDVLLVFSDVIRWRRETFTVRLPDALFAKSDAESRRRSLSKSDVVRERLTGAEGSRRRRPALLDAIAEIIGSVDGCRAI